MNREIEWIDQSQRLIGVVEQIGSGPLAVDTEADSYHHYREQVCLIQLTFDGRDVLVDPLAGADLEPLARIFADPAVTKILHGADYDLRVLDRDHGFTLRGVFDTMIAARLAGHRAFGLAALLEHYAEASLDKRHRLADWTQRPLPPELVDYAARDTRYLASLQLRLERELRALGRLGWAEEEFSRLEQVRWSAPAAAGEEFRTVKGSGRLRPRELALLQRLFEWRDGRARELDLPPTRLLGDRALVELSRAAPRTEQAVKALGLRGRWQRTEERRALLGEIERALERPREEWPRAADSRQGRLRPENTELVDRLRASREEAAQRLDLEPSLVASRGLLEAIVTQLDSGEDWRGLGELRRWQLAEIEAWGVTG